MSTRAHWLRTLAPALAAAGLLTAAACQPPQLPEPTVRLPELVQVRAGGQVQSVLLDDYVLGSVLAEVTPLNQPTAAVARIYEVQAVLARTYVAGHLGKHRSEGFDVCDTTHCQLYDPSRIKTSRFAAEAREAVRRTAGLVLTYQGHLAEGLYHADCGGFTASADEVWGGDRVPYLIAAPDDAAAVQHRQWKWTVSINDLRAALNASPRAEVGRTLDRVDVVDHDAGGHAARVAVIGEHTHELRGEEFRTVVDRALGPKAIQSTLFTISRDKTGVTFTGAGFGHGVGLCQIGAAARARNGESLDDILTHYFPGTRTIRASQ
jgi:stage II sporulation protein D